MPELDRIDRRILAELQADGRLSNTELAERVHLSASACLRRVKRLEEDGVIAGYVMLVDQAAIGRPTNVFVEITLQEQSAQLLTAFEQAVRACADIMECYLMTGEADYLLRMVAADVADFERIHRTVLTNLPGVAKIHSSFAMRTVCRTTSLPIK